MIKLTEKRVLFYSFVLFLIVVLLFTSMRAYRFDSITAGEDAYFHARVSKSVYIPETEKDPLMGREYTFSPYHLLLHHVSGSSVLKASNFLPVILGLASLVFFSLLLKKLGLDIEKRFFLMLILIISPAFIYMTSISNPHVFALLIGLVGFYLFFKENTVARFFSVLLFLLLPFFGVIETVILIVFLLGLYSLKKNKSLLILIAGLLAIYLLNFGFTVDLAIQQNALQSSVTDLGGMIGFGVFNILLAAIGFLLTWKFKKQHYPLYLVIIFLFVSVKFLGTMTNIYLNFIFAYLGCLAVARLVNRKWDSDIIKYLTVFVLISGLLFSGLSFLDRIANSGPDRDVVDSLLWLKQNSNPDDIVFSHQSKGFWIEFYSNRSVVADSYTTSVETLNDTYNLFWSRNLENTKRLLKKYDVEFIWIDPDMKQGLVWSKEEQGLLFLFKNRETFEKVYDSAGVEIWKVVSKDLN